MNLAALETLSEQLITLTRKRPGQYYSWDRLAARLETDHKTLQKALDQAAAWEYKLRLRPSKGVAFIAAPDLLTPFEIEHGLKTKWLGRTVYSYQSIKSTNDRAAQFAEDGAPAGTIVTSEEQTQGRGRLGRVWHSPPGSGIYVSMILRPSFTPEAAPGLAIMTAVALADTIAAYEPGRVQIKWPNDVWINRRKTAGILTELSAERKKINHVVIGVGININQRADDFPPEIRTLATSLRRERRHKVDRLELLRLFLRNLEKEYEKYLRHRLKKSHSKIRRYSALIGQEITLQFGRSRKTGLVKDIDAEGRLMLLTDSGVEPVTAGEVTVVKG